MRKSISPGMLITLLEEFSRDHFSKCTTADEYISAELETDDWFVDEDQTREQLDVSFY